MKYLWQEKLCRFRSSITVTACHLRPAIILLANRRAEGRKANFIHLCGACNEEKPLSATCLANAQFFCCFCWCFLYITGMAPLMTYSSCEQGNLGKKLYIPLHNISGNPEISGLINFLLLFNLISMKSVYSHKQQYLSISIRMNYLLKTHIFQFLHSIKEKYKFSGLRDPEYKTKIHYRV